MPSNANMKLIPDFSLSCLFHSFRSLSILIGDWWKAGYGSDHGHSLTQCSKFKVWDQLGSVHNISNLQKGPQSRACLPWNGPRISNYSLYNYLYPATGTARKTQSVQTDQWSNRRSAKLSKPQLGHRVTSNSWTQKKWGPSMFTKAPGGVCFTFTCDSSQSGRRVSIVNCACQDVNQQKWVHSQTTSSISQYDLARPPLCHWTSCQRPLEFALNIGEFPLRWAVKLLHDWQDLWSRAMSHFPIFPCLHRTIGE